MQKKTLGALIAAVCCVLIAGAIVSTRPSSVSSPNKNAQQSYTQQDVANHNTKSDCWTIIDNGVYDITDYVSDHPGGDEILRACGTDATELFHTRRDGDERVGSGTPHSSGAEGILENFKIG